jgi:hypothetical protein
LNEEKAQKIFEIDFENIVIGSRVSITAKKPMETLGIMYSVSIEPLSSGALPRWMIEQKDFNIIWLIIKCHLLTVYTDNS